MPVSAFKELVTSMFANGGDFSKFSTSQRAQAIKCYVKESFPHFLVADGHFYLPVYFTKKAIDDFKSKNTNVNITDLKTRVITINDWSLEMNQVNSGDVFTSYGGLEVRLVARSFKLEKGTDKYQMTVLPSNLYRDAEVKTCIQNYIHGHVVAAAAAAKSVLPDISAFKASGAVEQGVVGATTTYNFKEGKSSFVSLESIFKQEKGANALKSQGGSSGRVKVTGGATLKSKSKTIKKGSKKVTSVRALMNRGTPVDPKHSVKPMVGRGAMQTPGIGEEKASANISSMKDFKKMVSKIQQSKKINVIGKKSKK